MNTYLAEILNIPDARTAELRLDLGFHLAITRRLGIERIRVYHNESPDPEGATATEITPSEIATLPQTSDTATPSRTVELATLEDLPDLLRDESFQLLATTRKNSGSGWSADLHLVPGNLLASGGANADANADADANANANANAPVKGQSPQPGNTPPALWRYPAKVGRVIDGDTIDALIDVGFGIDVTERMRFKGIQAPEIFGVPTADPSYRRGIEAKHYVERRLAENNGRFQVSTSKQGKWRRWLAEVHLPDTDRTPAQLLRHIVERFLNTQPGT